MNHIIFQKEIFSASVFAQWKLLADFDQRDIAEWRDLADRALEPNVFLEPGFALAAAGMQGGGIGAVLVRNESRLLGLFPGEVEGLACGRPVQTFVAWTHPFAPLSTALVDRGLADEAVGKFLAVLPSIEGKPKLALFPLVNESGKTASVMAKAFLVDGRVLKRFSAHERAAYSPQAGDGIALSSRKLKELRRQRRRLEEEGALDFETVDDPSRIGDALTAYFRLEAKGWKGNGAKQSRDKIEQFMRDVVLAIGMEKKARIDTLRLNEASIASAITLFSGDRAWFWKISYDEDYARFSPGVQLALDVTENLAKRKNIALVDSCAVADHPMIDHLWARRVQFADWLLPLSGQASFSAGILFETARRMSVAGAKAVRGLLR